MKAIPHWLLALLFLFVLGFATIGIYYSVSDSWKTEILVAGYGEGYEKGYIEGYKNGYYDGRSGLRQ